MNKPERVGLGRILRLWRTDAGWLVAGVSVSMLSAALGAALMVGSGLLLAGAPLPLTVLAFLGPARVAARYGERLLTHEATFRALTRVRLWFFRGLAARSAAGLGFRRSGDLLSRLAGDVETLDGLYLRVLVPFAAVPVLLPILGYVLLRRGGGAHGWVALGLFLVTALILPALAAARAMDQGRRMTERRAALGVAALDLAAGLREIRAFGAEAMAETRLRLAEAEWMAEQGVAARRSAVFGALASLYGQTALLAVLAGAPAHPGWSVAGVFLLVAAFETIGGLPRAGSALGVQAAAAGRLAEIAEAERPLESPASAAKPEGAAIAFHDVRFGWDAARDPVLDGLSLVIPQGARVAVLGVSGAGKSTLAALALGAARPQAGRVTLGGVDLAALPAGTVRDAIAWVSQRSHLFDDSIAANLTLGRPGVDQAAMWRALDSAALGEVIRALPDGLETRIGEHGHALSGGQGRRLVLARALLAETPVLLLDEPCAGLDAETAAAFLRTLDDLPEDRTVILIQHRLTGVERLDHVWRIAGGKAVLVA